METEKSHLLPTDSALLFADISLSTLGIVW